MGVTENTGEISTVLPSDLAKAEQPKKMFLDLTPLRTSPPFARLWLGNLIAGVGTQMTIVAVGLHIYDLTQSEFAIAMTALIALFPTIVAGLFGGMLADRFDRRAIGLTAALCAWLAPVALAAVTWAGIEELWVFYTVTTVSAVSGTIIMTTRSSIVPRLLEPKLLPAASALHGISMGMVVSVGPALAGVLIALAGYAWTYTLDAVLFTAAFMGIWGLPKILPLGETQDSVLASIRYGLAYLKKAPNIQMSFIVDIIAMVFGSPRVIYPAVGAYLIGGGSVTVGVLTAALAVGTFTSSLFSGKVGQVRYQGRAVGKAVAVYGACVAGFALVLMATQFGWLGSLGTRESLNVVALVLAFVMLAGTGASDNISAIFRTTILQTAVPDNMRGRLQGIFVVVVTGGPRLGDLYIGVLAGMMLVWMPVLLGGFIIMALVGLLMRFQSTFKHYDALNPTA